MNPEQQAKNSFFGYLPKNCILTDSAFSDLNFTIDRLLTDLIKQSIEARDERTGGKKEASITRNDVDIAIRKLSTQDDRKVPVNKEYASKMDAVKKFRAEKANSSNGK